MPKVSPYCICLDPLFVCYTTKFWTAVAIQTSSLISRSGHLPRAVHCEQYQTHQGQCIFLQLQSDETTKYHLWRALTWLRFAPPLKQVLKQLGASQNWLMTKSIAFKTALLSLLPYHISNPSFPSNFLNKRSCSCLILSALAYQSAAVEDVLLERTRPYARDWKRLTFCRRLHLQIVSKSICFTLMSITIFASNIEISTSLASPVVNTCCKYSNSKSYWQRKLPRFQLSSHEKWISFSRVPERKKRVAKSECQLTVERKFMGSDNFRTPCPYSDVSSA